MNAVMTDLPDGCNSVMEAGLEKVGLNVEADVTDQSADQGILAQKHCWDDA